MIDPYTKKTWTPEEVIAYMKQSIKEFGHYTFCDEGPEAVMEIEEIGKYLSTLSLDNICDFIHKLRGKTLPNSDRARVAASLVHYLDSGPWTEEEFQRIADSSPESY